jgi:septum formation protein
MDNVAMPLPSASSAFAAPHAFVYLASQSPRRQQLLDQLGVVHRPLLPNGDGDTANGDTLEDAEALEAERAGELPLAYVQRVTLAKLQAAQARLKRRGLPPAPILCADTTVALGRVILGKPRDDLQALVMLSALSGRTHRVLTCVAVATGEASPAQMQTSLSRVRFAALSPATVARYVAGGEPRGKAGAYAIQGALAGHIAHIDGSHSGIMGLPLFETATLLRAAGVALAI